MNKKPIPPSKNALRTGAYSHDTVLPWESNEAYKRHQARYFAELQPANDSEILKDIASNYAENRWLRKRTRRMSAIETWRHPLGELLARSGAQTLQDTLGIINEHSREDREALRSIAESLSSILELLKGSREELESEKREKLIDDVSEHWQQLGHIENATDQVEKFFSEYSPERLHKRVLLENALDAQAYKLLARYSIEEERHALRKSQKAECAPASQSQSVSVNETAAAMAAMVRPLSGESGELDLAELDRDDSDVATDVLGEDEDWAKPQSPKGEDEDD